MEETTIQFFDTCNDEISPPPFEYEDIDSLFNEIAQEPEYTAFLSEPNVSYNTPSILSSTLPELTSILPSTTTTTTTTMTMTTTSPPLLSSPQLVPIKKEKAELSSHSSAQQPIMSSARPRTYTKKQKVEPQQVVKVEKVPEDKYNKRLQANKKSAQASRERKKNLRGELEQKVINLSKENTNLQIQITEVETENKVLANEVIQLQKLIEDSTQMTKFAAMQQYNNPLQFDTSRLLKPITASPVAAALYMMTILNTYGHYFTNLPSYQQHVESALQSNNNAVSVA